MTGSYFSEIFGASPVRPLQHHMKRVIKCVDKLPALIEGMLSGDDELRDAKYQRIVELEQEADMEKKRLRLHLPTSLFMPVDRRDVLEVLTMQDNVAGCARDIAGLVVMRDLVMPASLADDFRALLLRSVDACHQAHRTINEMDELVATGFGDKEIKRVNALLDELDAIESETDGMQFALSRRLMSIERELPPVEVMFLFALIDKTGTLADCAQRVGSRFQLLLAR